jgi:AcrR family transcriptional regulator
MPAMTGTGGRRTGRRKGGRGRGDSGTRAAILASARRLFSERGYGATTLRAIAADADVTSPLVLYFFGSKAHLFVEAVQWPFEPADVLPRLIDGGPDGIGERLVRFVVGVWDDEANRSAVLTMLRSASADPKAAKLLREFLVQEFFMPLTAALGQPDGILRANLVTTQILGLAMTRHVLAVEPLASLDGESIVELLAPTVQRFLTGDLPALSR